MNTSKDFKTFQVNQHHLGTERLRKKVTCKSFKIDFLIASTIETAVYLNFLYSHYCTTKEEKRRKSVSGWNVRFIARLSIINVFFYLMRLCPVPQDTIQHFFFLSRPISPALYHLLNNVLLFIVLNFFRFLLHSMFFFPDIIQRWTSRDKKLFFGWT